MQRRGAPIFEIRNEGDQDFIFGNYPPLYIQWLHNFFCRKIMYLHWDSGLFSGQLLCEEESFGVLLDDATRWGFELVVELCQEYLAQPKKLTNWDNLLICGYNSGNDHVVLECFKFFKVSAFLSIIFTFNVLSTWNNF